MGSWSERQRISSIARQQKTLQSEEYRQRVLHLFEEDPAPKTLSTITTELGLSYAMADCIRLTLNELVAGNLIEKIQMKRRRASYHSLTLYKRVVKQESA